MIILIGFLLLLVFMIIGLPVIYSFGVCAVVMMLGLGYELSFIVTTAYARTATYTLLCVPLFILAGGIIEKGRMGTYLIQFINKFVGRFKCALAYVSIITCGVFGALTGSAAATAASIGSILTPQLRKAGYTPGFIGALFANASILGLLIPPSTLMIVVAWSTGLSVLACFMCTLLPGIVLICFLCIVSAVLNRNNHNLQAEPSMPPKEWAIDLAHITKKAFPILLLPIIILGGIYGGLITPTESAAVGAFYAIIIAMFVYRTMSVKGLKEVLVKSGTTAGVIMMSMFMVGVVSKVLTYAGLPELIVEAVHRMGANRYIVMLCINVILIIMGMLMDDTCVVLISAPLFFPLAQEIGFEPYHFAAIMGVNMGMATLTPPSAPSLYTCSRICQAKVGDMLKPDMQFLLFAWVPTLILTILIPDLSLFIPRLMGLV